MKTNLEKLITGLDSKFIVFCSSKFAHDNEDIFYYDNKGNRYFNNIQFVPINFILNDDDSIYAVSKEYMHPIKIGDNNEIFNSNNW